MPISYTIEKVSTASLQVRYQDGSYAIIPIHKKLSKPIIDELIASYNNQVEPFDEISTVPYKEGDTGLILSPEEQQKHHEDTTKVGYAELRRMRYPSIGDQLDALYWARTSNPEPLKQLDQRIKDIKDQYPKDMEPVSLSQLIEAEQPSFVGNTDELINFLEG